VVCVYVCVYLGGGGYMCVVCVVCVCLCLFVCAIHCYWFIAGYQTQASSFRAHSQ